MHDLHHKMTNAIDFNINLFINLHFNFKSIYLNWQNPYHSIWSIHTFLQHFSHFENLHSTKLQHFNQYFERFDTLTHISTFFFFKFCDSEDSSLNFNILINFTILIDSSLFHLILHFHRLLFFWLNLQQFHRFDILTLNSNNLICITFSSQISAFWSNC